MATGASNGNSRIINTCLHLLGSCTNHIIASMSRRKVAGRKVAEMIMIPQTGFPSLMKFTPLTRSEKTSKMKSPRSGSKLLSTTKICLVRVYSPSRRILARVKNCMSSQQVTLDGQAWTTTSRKKRKRNDFVMQAITFPGQQLRDSDLHLRHLQ